MVRSPAEEAFEAIAPRIDPVMLIVTARDGEERAGCLVGFHAQCSIEPLRHLLMVSKANRTWRVTRRASHLVVHVCDERDIDLARLFGGETGDDVDKFERCEWEDGPAGAPVLRGCHTWLEGEVLGRHDVGDHVAHVVAWTHGVAAEGLRPLRLAAIDDLEAGHPA